MIQKKVSVHSALYMMQHATDGLRLLANFLQADGCNDDDTKRIAPAIGALAGMLGLHIENVLRLMRREVDARVAWTTETQAPEFAAEDYDDLILFAPPASPRALDDEPSAPSKVRAPKRRAKARA